MNYPNAPVPNTTNLQWLRRVAQAGRANRPRAGRGLRASHTSSGTIFHSSKGQRPAHSPFHVKSVQAEYLVCRTWDGENEGTKDFKVAKPPELRNSVDVETIDGTDVNYSDYDNDAQTRLADDGTNQETQVIVPRYLVDTVIFVFRANTCAVDEDENPIALQDANVAGRAWAVTASS